MNAVLADIVIYGIPFVIGLGALKVFGRYYGRKKPPKPDDGTKPKDE